MAFTVAQQIRHDVPILQVNNFVIDKYTVNSHQYPTSPAVVIVVPLSANEAIRINGLTRSISLHPSGYIFKPPEADAIFGRIYP